MPIKLIPNVKKLKKKQRRASDKELAEPIFNSAILFIASLVVARFLVAVLNLEKSNSLKG